MNNPKFAFLIAVVFVVGCGRPHFTKERYQQVNPDDFTREEVVSLLGPGEEVKNDYTNEQIELRDLPDDTTFIRWRDPADPKTLTHIGFSSGKIVHRSTLEVE